MKNLMIHKPLWGQLSITSITCLSPHLSPPTWLLNSALTPFGDGVMDIFGKDGRCARAKRSVTPEIHERGAVSLDTAPLFKYRDKSRCLELVVAAEDVHDLVDVHLLHVLAENPSHFDPRQYLKPARENMKKMYIHMIVDVLGSNDKL